mmetsp:Transcript_31927/g.101703  ORF Transcript_31927/g.101703 Transcript_31927/m.101703 type:complete len:201 (-) Transcript_31927:1022-1624(-)
MFPPFPPAKGRSASARPPGLQGLMALSPPHPDAGSNPRPLPPGEVGERPPGGPSPPHPDAGSNPLPPGEVGGRERGLQAVHRFGQGLHRRRIRDTDARGRPKRIPGHEREVELLENVHAEGVAVGHGPPVRGLHPRPEEGAELREDIEGPLRNRNLHPLHRPQPANHEVPPLGEGFQHLCHRLPPGMPEAQGRESCVLCD